MDSKNLNEKKTGEQNVQNENVSPLAVENYPYVSPTPDELPIVCIAPFEVFSPNSVTLNILESVKNAGFNLIQKALSTENTSKLLAMLPTGLDCMARKIPNSSDTDKDVQKEFYIAFVKSLLTDSNLDRIKMWMLCDEPAACDMDFWQSIYDTWLSLIAPKDQSIYINLSPAYRQCINGSNHDVSSSLYPKFLNDFNDMFHPALWSYDLYCFMLDKNTNEVIFNPDFYTYLKYYLDISRSTNRPFWAYVLCCQYGVPLRAETEADVMGSFDHKSALPTLGQMRMEAFTALACGAKGLCFWRLSPTQSLETYINTNKGKNNPGEYIYEAPFTLDGNQTSIFWDIKSLLSEIKETQNYFLDSDVETVALLSSANPNFPKITFPFVLLNSVSASSDYGFLFSHITNSMGSFLVIINQNFGGTQTLRATTVNGKKGTVVYGPSKGVVLSSSLMNYSFNFSAGQCMIIQLN